MELNVYRDISQSADKNTLNKRVTAWAHGLDFEIGSGALFIDWPGERKPTNIPIGNTPEAFLQAHNDSGLVARDPVMKRLKETSIPFIYDQQTYVAGGAPDLHDLQSQFGFATGVATSMHMPSGRHLYIGIDRRSPLPENEHARVHLMGQVQLLAVHVAEAAVSMTCGATTETECPLTPRELECMKWTIESKTAGEVGDILSISTRTVTYHIASAVRKLDAVNKRAAAMKALRLGWITC